MRSHRVSEDVNQHSSLPPDQDDGEEVQDEGEESSLKTNFSLLKTSVRNSVTQEAWCVLLHH